jgi:hypothetical protein
MSAVLPHSGISDDDALPCSCLFRLVHRFQRRRGGISLWMDAWMRGNSYMLRLLFVVLFRPSCQLVRASIPPPPPWSSRYPPFRRPLGTTSTTRTSSHRAQRRRGFFFPPGFLLIRSDSSCRGKKAGVMEVVRRLPLHLASAYPSVQ